MATSNDVKELFEKYIRIEHEIKLLQDDKKELLSGFKDKVDPKVFPPSALRAAKAKTKLNAGARQEFDNVMLQIEAQLSIENID